MITRNLWRAEWLKTHRMPINKLIYRGLPVMLAMVFAIMTIAALANPEQNLSGARTTLSFPFPLRTTSEVFMALGPLLTMIFIANSVGSEYGRDTWKMIMPRYGSRGAFLVAKLATLLAGMVIMLLTTIVVTCLVGLLGALILGIDPILYGAVNRELFEGLLIKLGYTLIHSLFYGALTLLTTILSRSTIGGAMIGFILAIGAEGVSFLLIKLWRPLGLAFPMLHLENLSIKWIDDYRFMRERFEQLLGGPVSATQSLLVVLAYTAIFTFGAFHVFRKRDMAG